MPDLFLTVFHEINSEIGNRLKSDSHLTWLFLCHLQFHSYSVYLNNLPWVSFSVFMWCLSYAWLGKYWCICVLGFFFFLLNFLFNKVKKLVENVFWWRGHGFKSFASERITFSVLRKWAFSPTQITEKMNQIPDLGYKSHREHEMLHGILLQWLPPASQSPLQTLGYSRNAVHFGDEKKEGFIFHEK